MSMLAAATAYAHHGFPVFPAKPTPDKARGSKAPLLPGESKPGAKDGGHWLASCEPAKIEAWWRRWPDALIGFPTGARTGTVVIDLDPRTVPLSAMLDALTRWCGGGLGWVDPETGEVIAPAVAETQSGGLHLYFRHQGQEHQGHEIGNRAGVFSGFIKSGEASHDLDHIDVRGDGGYVIAPPSVMENGNRYSWVRKPGRGEDGGWLLPPMPPALRRVVTRERLPRAAKPAPAPQRFTGTGNVARYVEKRIDGILATVRTAPDGSRNAYIHWGGLRLGEMVLGGFLTSGHARDLLIGNLPSGVSPGEPKALKSIERGLTYPGLQPWTPEQMQGRAA